MNDFLSLRNNNRPKTQEELDILMANEPDVLPAYGGAGSMLADLKRGSKQHRPTDARARLTAAERQQFAKENAEVIYTTPEERAQIEAKLAEAMKRDDIKRLFANAVRKNQPLDDLWSKAGGEGDILAGFERDGDPTGAPEAQIIAAFKAFAESPVFVAYRSTDKNSPRGKVKAQVLDVLWNFMQFNLINMTLTASWARAFGFLENLGVFPAPIPTAEQLQAADRAKPATDGGQVALHEDGTPVTYKFKDGRVVRYSKQMLDALPSEGYAKVMNLRAVPQESEEERRARKAHEYRSTIVAGGYTQYELDQMPSEKYRQVMKLSRAPMAMKPFDRL